MERTAEIIPDIANLVTSTIVESLINEAQNQSIIGEVHTEAVLTESVENPDYSSQKSRDKKGAADYSSQSSTTPQLKLKAPLHQTFEITKRPLQYSEVHIESPIHTKHTYIIH